MVKKKRFLKNAYFAKVLGIIFDTKRKMILIGKKICKGNTKRWTFPGSNLLHGQEPEDVVKRGVWSETGLKVESLGTIFAKTYPDKRGHLSIYFLCETVGGKERVGEDFEEIKWVRPKEVKDYLPGSFHPKLREYIEGLSLD